MIHAHAGRASGSTTNAGTRPWVSERAISVDRVSDHRKPRVPRPTHTPAPAPSTAHLSVLMTSAVCSVYQRLSSERRGDSSPGAELRSRLRSCRTPEGICAPASLSTNGRRDGDSVSRLGLPMSSALRYPGFAYMAPSAYVSNPATVVLAALTAPLVPPRVTEALPWLLVTFVDLDWRWLVDQAKLSNVQNRLGFLVHLAKQVADRRSEVGAVQ